MEQIECGGGGGGGEKKKKKEWRGKKTHGMKLTLDIFEFRNKFGNVYFVYLCTYKYSFERWNVIDDRLSGHLGCLHQKYTHKYWKKNTWNGNNSQQPTAERKIRNKNICNMRALNMQTDSHTHTHRDFYT